jgi:signal transduction histidine kinase
MKRRPVVLASVLVTAAITVPMLAWYRAGMFNLDAQERQERAKGQQEAQTSAVTAAARVADRLEALLKVESRRPYFHYQRYFHDPEGQYQGVGVTPSPLADENWDPLVVSYFQVDRHGRVETPSEAMAAKALAASFAAVVPRDDVTVAARSTVAQRKKVPQQAYMQNQAAQSIFENLQQKKAVPWTPPSPGPNGEVEVVTGALAWSTAVVNNVPHVLATRDVMTPDGLLQQGFAVPLERLQALVEDGRTTLVARRAQDAMDANVPLRGVGWSVVVQPPGAEEEAAVLAALRRQFLTIFGAALLLALLCGLAVILLVQQAHAVALQRAQFAATAAHELRTPLAGLRMYAEMLAEGLGDPNKRASYARTVANEAERLGRVVGNVLSFSRLERGVLQVRAQREAVAPLLEECSARAQPWLAAHGATLELDVAPGLPEVALDRDAVAQMVGNLLDNAEKYGRGCADRRIHLRAAHVGGALELTVEDHGPGISAAAQRRLFTPFVRGDQVDAPEGLGLGLALVRALAHAHGGGVKVTSSLGGGTRVCVSLPG